MGVHNELTHKLLQSYWQDVKAGQCRFVAFDCAVHPGYEKIIGQLIDELKPDQLLNYKFSSEAWAQPYAPLRSIFHQLRVVPEEQSTLYQPLRDEVKGYLTQAKTTVREEMAYEPTSVLKLELLDNLTRRATEVVAGKATILWFDHLEFAPASTWEFLEHFCDKALPGNILIIGSYDTMVHFEDELHSDSWNLFSRKFDDHRIALSDDEEQAAATEHALPPKWLPMSLDESQGEIELYSNQISLLAFNDIKIAFDDPKGKGLDAISDTNGFRKYEYFADALFHLEEYSQASILYERLASTPFAQQDDATLARAHRKLAMAFHHRLEDASAKRYAANALSINQELKDEQAEIFALFTLFIIEGQQLKFSLYERLLSLLDKAHPLIKAYCKRKSYTFHRYYEQEHVIGDYQKTLAYYEDDCEIAIQTYQALRDQHGLANAYQELSIVLSLQGRFDVSLGALRECQQLRDLYSNPVEIVGVHNGMGYLHMLLSQYTQAHTEGKLALQQIWNIRDYKEIGVTLFNLGFNAMYAQQFDQAYKAFESIIDLMVVLGIKYIPFHSYAEVRLLAAVNAMLANNTVQAMELFAQLTERDCQDNSQTKSLYAFLEALFNVKSEHAPPDIHQAFEKAFALLDDNIFSDKCLKPFYFFEYCRYLIKQQPEFVNATLIRAKQSCVEVKNTVYEQWFDYISQYKKVTDELIVYLKPIPINLRPFLGLARKETEVRSLQSKLHEIQFLQSIQTIFVTSETQSELCNSFVSQIRSHYPIEVLLVVELDKHKEDPIIAKSVPKSFATDWVHQVMSQHDLIPDRVILGQDEIQHIIKGVLPEVHNLAAIKIQATSKSQFIIFIAAVTDDEGLLINRDEVDIISLASGQLATVIAKIEQELELKRLSTTDILTGLANRTSWEQRLSQEIQRIKRYGSADHSLAIAFIDLDNFKTYNDSYGHEVGDLVLQRFSQIIHQCIRDVDFAARFGGDEFVLLLPETESAGAAVVANRVLERFNVLVEQLEDYIRSELKMKISDNTDKRLGVSIGVSGLDLYESSDRSIQKLLSSADQAVYKAKAAGKNSVHVWTPADGFSGEAH